jgi:hypothetical protein
MPANRNSGRPAVLAALSWLAVEISSVGASQPAGQQSIDTADVTINAKRLTQQQRVRTFVSHVTARTADDSIAVWHEPICLRVTGLRQDQSEFVRTRLSQIVESAGAPLVAKDCRPNFHIIVTARPDALLKAWGNRDKGAVAAWWGPVRSFVDTPRPVRIWYNVDIKSADGKTLGPDCPGFSTGLFDVRVDCNASATRLRFNELVEFNSLVVIVDLIRTTDVTLGQVVDYIALIGLTKVNLDADMHGVPTILRIFGPSEDDKVESLSDWDESFLKAVYHTNRTLRGQSSDIARHMIRDIAP